MPSLPRSLCAILAAGTLAASWTATAAAQATSISRTDSAATLAAKAREAYEAGRFREAITLYEEAYAREANPTLLFNAGRCHEALATAEDLARAVERYEAYLRGAPGAADRAAVARRIEALREQIRVMQRAAEPAPPAPAPITPAREAPEPDPVSPWPWVVAGVGAGGVVAGVVLGVVATNEHDAAIETRSGAEAEEHASRADGLGVAATVAYVAGGVICAAGVAWGIVDVATRKDVASSLQVRVGIAGATLVGRF